METQYYLRLVGNDISQTGHFIWYWVGQKNQFKGLVQCY